MTVYARLPNLDMHAIIRATETTESPKGSDREVSGLKILFANAVNKNVNGVFYAGYSLREFEDAIMGTQILDLTDYKNREAKALASPKAP